MENPVHIPAFSGRGFVVRRGQTIKVIDVEGQQIGDFVCFNLHNPREKLSPSETFTFNSISPGSNFSLNLSVGGKFYSNAQNPMFEITEDCANGMHDILFPPCSSAVYLVLFGEPGHPNCRANLTQAVKPFGLDYLDVPSPVNLFQNSRPKEDGTIKFRPPTTKPGDYICLKALLDCIVAISSCSFDRDGVNGDKCTPLRVEFTEH